MKRYNDLDCELSAVDIIELEQFLEECGGFDALKKRESPIDFIADEKKVQDLFWRVESGCTDMNDSVLIRDIVDMLDVLLVVLDGDPACEIPVPYNFPNCGFNIKVGTHCPECGSFVKSSSSEILPPFNKWSGPCQ